MRCFKCQKYGNGQNTCARCGQIDHDSKSCKNDIQCVNCKGNHFAYSRECARWKVEKKVWQLKVEKHISFYEDRKLVEALAPVATGPSYAAFVKASTKSISINTDLTWCYKENKYKNVADVETLQRQTEKPSEKTKRERNEQKDSGVFRSKKVEYCGARPQSPSARKRHQIK